MNHRHDLNHVAIFLEVVDSGSFASAARRLNLKANTVSRSVQQLEDTLGVRLVQRSTRQLSLTDAGRLLSEGAAPTFEVLAKVLEQVSHVGLAPCGAVRIAVPTDFLEFFSAEWLSIFLEKHPAVQLDLVTTDARSDVIGEGIDVAFRGGVITEPSLIARRLGTFSLSLVASPAYIARRGVPSSLDELSTHDVITPSRSVSRSVWRFSGSHQPVEVPVTGRFSAGSARSQLNAALAGLGIARLPTVISEAALNSGRLVDVLHPDCVTWMEMHAVYSSRKLLSPAVRALISFVEEKVVNELQPRQLRGGSRSTSCSQMHPEENERLPAMAPLVMAPDANCQ